MPETSARRKPQPLHQTNSLSLVYQFQKAYHLLEPKDRCNKVAINVTVEGKVKYTRKLLSLAAEGSHVLCRLKPTATARRPLPPQLPSLKITTTTMATTMPTMHHWRRRCRLQPMDGLALALETGGTSRATRLTRRQ